MFQRGLKAPAAIAKGTLAPLKAPAEKKEGEEKQMEEVVRTYTRRCGRTRLLAALANDRKSGAPIVVLMMRSRVRL